MLNVRLWIIYSLLFLTLVAQDAQILPEGTAGSPPVDMITPVPPPEIPFGGMGEAPIATPKNLVISNYGGGRIEGVRDVGVRYVGPGVKVTGDSGLELYSDSVLVDFKAQTATLEGNVSIYQGNILQRGDRAVYHYERKFLDASGLRVSLDPIILEAGKFTAEQRGDRMVFVGEDAGITTQDVENPNYWIRARKTTIYPADKVIFNDLKLFAGDVPIFWLPYLNQPLDGQLGYHFLPGARSNWGPYLLNTYGVMLGGDYNPETGENENAWLLSRWHLDLRSKRGIGAGIDLVDTRVQDTDELSGFSFYHTYDLAPDTEIFGIPRDSVDPNRFEVTLKHRLELDFPDLGEWRLDSNFSILSDEYYLEDFDLANFRTNPSPDNTLGLYRRDDDSLLSFLTRYRLNDFYQTDTRLPEVSFDHARRSLFGTPILHEGKTSLGFIGEQSADFTTNMVVNPLMKLTAGDPEAQPLLNQFRGYNRLLAEQLLALPLNDPRRKDLRTQLTDPNYARFSTYQDFSLPIQLGSMLNITPQAGLGYTRYDAANWSFEDQDRTYVHLGTEISTKISKDYHGYKNPAWGLDGLKHIIQPYAAWSFVNTDEFGMDRPNVDRLTETTRPRPLDPIRFNAIDDLQSWNIIRMGMRNRLLTKRDSQAFEWLYMDTYIDKFIEDPERDRDFSNLYNDLHWRMLPWLELTFNTQIPIISGGTGFHEIESSLRFMPTQNFEFEVGYRELAGHPVLIDSNQINLRTYTRLNDFWGVGTQHILELDDGTLELQQYTVHRDLGNWVLGFGLNSSDNRFESEYGFVFSLTLKDFPSLSLPFEMNAR
jgi:LPS-assembly protein